MQKESFQEQDEAQLESTGHSDAQQSQATESALSGKSLAWYKPHHTLPSGFCVQEQVLSLDFLI